MCSRGACFEEDKKETLRKSQKSVHPPVQSSICSTRQANPHLSPIVLLTQSPFFVKRCATSCPPRRRRLRRRRPLCCPRPLRSPRYEHPLSAFPLPHIHCRLAALFRITHFDYLPADEGASHDSIMNRACLTCVECFHADWLFMVHDTVPARVRNRALHQPHALDIHAPTHTRMTDPRDDATPPSAQGVSATPAAPSKEGGASTVADTPMGADDMETDQAAAAAPTPSAAPPTPVAAAAPVTLSTEPRHQPGYQERWGHLKQILSGESPIGLHLQVRASRPSTFHFLSTLDTIPKSAQLRDAVWRRCRTPRS